MTNANKQLDGTLIYLASEDIRVAASLLFQAYQSDPIFQHVFQHEKDGYDQRLRAAIREELMLFWQNEQPMFGVFEQDTLEGVVCLTRPGEHFKGDRVWHWRLKMLLTAGYVSTKQMLEEERLISEAIPAQNYHMVVFIAVQPRYQQRGLGDRLVQAVQEELRAHPEAEGVAVFLTKPEYERFFGARGYQPLAEIDQGNIRGKLLYLDRQSLALEVPHEGE